MRRFACRLLSKASTESVDRLRAPLERLGRTRCCRAARAGNYGKAFGLGPSTIGAARARGKL